MSNLLVLNADGSYQIILYTTGVGASAIQHFTMHPGSSQFALECASFYAMGSLELLVKHKIQKYVCQQIAEEMAEQALVRAHEILRIEGRHDKCKKIIGVGMTGAIKTLKPKTGKHHAFYCIHFGHRKYDYYIDLTKDARTRDEEDQIISQLLYQTILQHVQNNYTEIQIQNGNLSLINKSEEMINTFMQMLTKQTQIHSILLQQNSYQINPIIKNGVILSGSFNPIHQGHLDLIQQASLACDIQEHYFELSIVNAEKGLITTEEIQKRVDIMQQKNVNIILSNKPLYIEKNIFLENGAFALGIDTFIRLINPKYYNNSLKERDFALVQIVMKKNKLVVAPRLNEMTQQLERLSDCEIPHLLDGSVLELGNFRNDISSTKIRNGK